MSKKSAQRKLRKTGKQIRRNQKGPIEPHSPGYWLFGLFVVVVGGALAILHATLDHQNAWGHWLILSGVIAAIVGLVLMLALTVAKHSGSRGKRYLVILVVYAIFAAIAWFYLWPDVLRPFFNRS